MFDKLLHDLNRLRLRALRADDIDAFYEYRSDPVVATYQGWNPMNVPAAAEYLRLQSSQRELMPGSWRQLAIADRETDQLLGDMGIWLSPDSSQAEFGLSITSSAQGKGYGVESVRGLLDLLFATTPVTEVVANTDIRNVACRLVLERSGMQHVNTREAEYKGETCMELWFRIAKP